MRNRFQIRILNAGNRAFLLGERVSLKPGAVPLTRGLGAQREEDATQADGNPIVRCELVLEPQCLHVAGREGTRETRGCSQAPHNHCAMNSSATYM
jgi:hypothetical protein